VPSYCLRLRYQLYVLPRPGPPFCGDPHSSYDCRRTPAKCFSHLELLRLRKSRIAPHADEPECKGYEVSCIFVEHEKDRPCDTPCSHSGSKRYSRMW
jgi:hypothetical protein